MTQRGIVTHRRTRLRVAMLLATAWVWTSPSCTETHAQTSSTSTTTATTTTATTTTLPVPLALREIIADLDALSRYTDALRACHTSAMTRTANGHQLEAHCDTIGHAARRARCERVLGRFRCRSVHALRKCEAVAVVAASQRLVDLGIASRLRSVLATRTQGVACMIGTPVDGLTTDASLGCPLRARPVKPGRFKQYLRLPCATSHVCDDLDCTGDALSTLAGAMRAAVGCRADALAKVAVGEVFDEAACTSSAWAGCVSVGCTSQPCFAMEALCAESKAFVDETLSVLSAPSAGCITDEVVGCDDGNPCTLDRCDGKRCRHDTAADGLACGSSDDPCRVNACRQGACTTESSPNDVPCPDEGDACTLDVCRGGECTHPPNETKLGKPCIDGAPCTICVADRTTMHCAERTCPDGCVCNLALGCVLESGTGRCP
jgi:hypothetical protein